MQYAKMGRQGAHDLSDMTDGSLCTLPQYGKPADLAMHASVQLTQMLTATGSPVALGPALAAAGQSL